MVAFINAILLVTVLVITIRTTATASTIACYTTPGEECYREAQDQQQDVIKLLIDAEIAAEECSTAADVRGCVEQKLAPWSTRPSRAAPLSGLPPGC